MAAEFVMPTRCDLKMKIKIIAPNIDILKYEFDNILVSTEGKNIMLDKTLVNVFKIENLSVKLSQIIKQEMLSLGGDFALPKNIFNLNFEDTTSGLLIGTINIYKKLINKLSQQTFKKLREFSFLLENQINIRPTLYWRCKNKNIKLNKILIMGILNVTPDSFYDGGKYTKIDLLKKRIDELIKEGSDIIDIGGESSRPGAKKITIREELKRVLPAIKHIKKHYKIPVSIDTYKSQVAEEVLKEDADIVNDISGLQFDKKMGDIIKKYNAGLVLMHIKGKPENMQNNPKYKNVMEELYYYFTKQINYAINNGIQKESIVIDPGIGFGKTMHHNFEILKRLNELNGLNHPVLIGLSNKSLIKDYLKLELDERLSSTIALNTLSIINGAKIIRVHNVKENKKAIRIIEGVMNEKNNK